MSATARFGVGVFCAAHRGLSAEHPENTLTAFREAVKAGFPALEMDLRTTADGEVVILHDPGIERTTGGNGRVGDMRYDELRGYSTPAGPIPRLDDLFRSLKDWKGLWNLELKSSSAAEGTIYLLEHHRLIHRAQFTSFDDEALRVARQHDPDLSRGLIVLGPPEDGDLEVAADLGCEWLNADAEFLTEPVVRKIREKGFRMGAWTVNDPVQAGILADWGVECLITDTRRVLEAMAPRADSRPTF